MLESFLVVGEMDESVLENLNSGIVYLYASGSKREFYQSLEWFLAGVIGESRFSVIRDVRRRGWISIEYTNAIDASVLESETREFRASGLAAVLRKGFPQDFSRLEAPTVRFGDQIWPVVHSRPLHEGEHGSWAIVFHDEAPLRATSPDSVGVDVYAFDHVASAWLQVHEREILREAYVRENATVNAIERIGGVLGTLDLETLLSRLISVCVDLCDAQVGSVRLIGDDPRYAEWGLPEILLSCLATTEGEGLVDAVIRDGRSLLVPEYSRSAGYRPALLFDVRSFLCVPIVGSEGVLGTIQIVNSAVKGGSLNSAHESAMRTVAALAGTAISNAVLHERAIAQRSTEASLGVAREIQRGMLPRGDTSIPGYDVAWSSESCDETGGDYVDFVDVSDDQTCIVVGDVSGHGVGSALVMAAGRAHVRAHLATTDALNRVVEQVNDALEGDLQTSSFMTLFLARLDLRTHHILFVNAGHDQPLLYRSAEGSVEPVCQSGLPLGMFPNWSYQTSEIQPLLPGDGLLITTDGIWEQPNRKGEPFGKARLAQAFLSNIERGSAEIVARILDEVRRHARGIPFRDDQTLVVVRRLRDASPEPPA